MLTLLISIKMNGRLLVSAAGQHGKYVVYGNIRRNIYRIVFQFNLIGLGSELMVRVTVFC